MNNKNVYKMILFILILTSLFSGCSSKEQSISLHKVSKIDLVESKKKPPSPSFYQEFDLPISIKNGEFGKVVGWLSNEEIIYMTNSDEGSSLFSYQLKEGKNDFLYNSKYPIITVQVSPDRRYILIHSSPSTYEGLVTVINNKGEERFSRRIPSVEMVFEWNKYNLDELLITAFKEDWSFLNYILTLDNLELKPIDIRKPFAKWLGKNKFAFMDWDENEISLTSPLIQSDLGHKEEILKDKIFQFDTFLDKILTITVDGGNQLADYQFYSNEMKEISSFQAPVLANYSGWLIPNYELSEDGKYFITILPKESGEADSYKGEFKLVSYNLESGKPEIILNNTKNLPFICSPDNKFCLIGYQLESLLDLKLKTITSLVKTN